MSESETTNTQPLTRPTDVQRALDYLANIWGDFGRHERYTEIVTHCIEDLEKRISLLKNNTNDDTEGDSQ